MPQTPYRVQVHYTRRNGTHAYIRFGISSTYFQQAIADAYSEFNCQYGIDCVSVVSFFVINEKEHEARDEKRAQAS